MKLYHWLLAIVLAFTLGFAVGCRAPLVGGYVGQSDPSGDGATATETGVIVLFDTGSQEPSRPPQPSDGVQRDDDLEGATEAPEHVCPVPEPHECASVAWWQDAAFLTWLGGIIVAVLAAFGGKKLHTHVKARREAAE